MTNLTASRETIHLQLKTSLSRVVDLTEQEFNAVAQLFFRVSLRKREHWFTEGSICTEIAFVLKGSIRTYFLKDGQEKTTQFFFENSWFTDYESWLTKEPAAVGVQAVENAELLLIPFHELEKLYLEIPKFERVGRIMAEQALISSCKRKVSLLKDTPEEAYLKLLEERPKVIERVPQHMIASYLGIEPETLSRIRKKISIQVL